MKIISSRHELPQVLAFPGLFLKNFNELARAAHSPQLTIDLIDVSIPQVGLEKSTEPSREVPEVKIVHSFTCSPSVHFLVEHHLSDAALYLFRAEVLEPMVLCLLMRFDEVFGYPFDSCLGREVRGVAVEEFS